MSGKAFTPKRIRRSVKLDRVHPADFNKYDFTYCCEQCSHFSKKNTQCTLGFPATLHTKDVQLKRYHSLGHMAFCRFLEID